MRKQNSNIVYQLPNYPLFGDLLINVSNYNFKSNFKAETKERIRQLDYLIKKIRFYSVKYLEILGTTADKRQKYQTILRTYTESFYLIAYRMVEILETEDKNIKKSDVSLVRNHLIVHANTKPKHGYSTWSFGFSTEHGPKLNQAMLGRNTIDDNGQRMVVVEHPPTTEDNGLVSNARQFYDYLNGIFQ